MSAKKKSKAEVLRFAITGTIVTAILYATYLPLAYIIDPSLAYSIGFGISFVSNFLLSTYYTFKTKPTKSRAFLFCFVQFINYLLQIAFFELFIRLGVDKAWAPAPVWIIIFPINFILMRIALISTSIPHFIKLLLRK